MASVSQFLAEVAHVVGDYTFPYVQKARLYVNSHCAGSEAWQLILGTWLVTIAVVWVYIYLFYNRLSVRQRLMRWLFHMARYIPSIRERIENEMGEAKIGILAGLNKPLKGCHYIRDLPKKGMSDGSIITLMTDYNQRDEFNWKGGMVSGAVYGGTDELTKLATEVYKQSVWTNPLHPDIFPGVRKMEAEIISWTIGMFNGNENSCGVVASGGTESILLACLAYRNLAYQRGIHYPEMVVSVTAHAAFDKAADYFNIKIIHIPIDADNFEMDFGKFKAAINKNTCVLVGSAPNFPHGLLDPLKEIGKLGLKHNIPVHMDCCLGGWLVPFMRKAGFDIPQYDLTTPGITSISADTHKYACAPKGTSVLIYSDEKYRRLQYFVQPNWPGGVYATATLAGSRAGSSIAGCWATLLHFGEHGYIEQTKKIINTRIYLEKNIRKIEGIKVAGKPDVSVVAVYSKDFNIFRLSSKLAKRGWNLNALQFPSCFHVCVTMLWSLPGVADKFLNDLRVCVAKIMKNPTKNAKGTAAVYGTSQLIPDRSIIADVAAAFLDACFTTDVDTSNGNLVENGNRLTVKNGNVL